MKASNIPNDPIEEVKCALGRLNMFFRSAIGLLEEIFSTKAEWLTQEIPHTSRAEIEKVLESIDDREKDLHERLAGLQKQLVDSDWQTTEVDTDIHPEFETCAIAVLGEGADNAIPVHRTNEGLYDSLLSQLVLDLRRHHSI